MFNSSANYQDITIALAGMVLAAQNINDLAKHGRCDEDSFLTLVYSLFQQSPDDVNSIYKSITSITSEGYDNGDDCDYKGIHFAYNNILSGCSLT